MSAPFALAPLALDDLDDIHAYLEDVTNGTAADRVIDALYEAFDVIAARPGLGHKRPDLTDFDLFFWTALKRYAVIYRKGSPIEIVRVVPWLKMEPAMLSRTRGFSI